MYSGTNTNTTTLESKKSRTILDATNTTTNHQFVNSSLFAKPYSKFEIDRNEILIKVFQSVPRTVHGPSVSHQLPPSLLLIHEFSQSAAMQRCSEISQQLHPN